MNWVLFDLEAHKAKYINYLEVLILENGSIVYAIPSHQECLISLCTHKMNISRQELLDLCPREYYLDFMTWLCNITHAVPVWYYGYAGNPNPIQSAVLRKLAASGVYGGTVPKRPYRVSDIAPV